MMTFIFESSILEVNLKNCTSQRPPQLGNTRYNHLHKSVIRKALDEVSLLLVLAGIKNGHETYEEISALVEESGWFITVLIHSQNS